MTIFKQGHFTLHSGATSSFKIDCDGLTDEDIEALACLIAKRTMFREVIGVPRGGLRLARALEKFATIGPRLIVDDVLTTGKSMSEYMTEPDDIGYVIFARLTPPRDNIKALFNMHNV